MDKTKYLRLRDAELVIGLSRHGAVVAARGWLAVFVVVAAALVGLTLLMQRIT
jgi:hypothetical protein